MHRAALVMTVAIAIMPGIAHALGLGNLEVYSALNERLSTEIEFTPISNKQLRTLTAGVGSQADFAAAGLERLSANNKDIDDIGRWDDPEPR